MQSQIMFIEPGGAMACSVARIGRVQFSQTGKTLRYGGCDLRSLKGRGFKENYYDVESDELYWICRPHRDGRDALYNVTVEIDEDVLVEYWCEIRQLPEKQAVTSFRSPGKYSGKKWHRV